MRFLLLCGLFFLALPATAQKIELEWAVPPTTQYDEIREVQEGIAVVLRGEKFGFIDTLGRELCAPQYAYILEFSDGRGVTFAYTPPKFDPVNSKTLLINKKAAVLDTFDWMPHTSAFCPDGKATVNKDGKDWLINTKGEKIKEMDMMWFGDCLKNGTARSVSTYGGQGFAVLDQNWDYVVPYGKYNEIKWFEKGIAIVKSGGKYGCIDEQGKEIIPTRYDQAHLAVLGEGKNEIVIVTALVGNAWGVFDKTGQQIIAPKYEAIMPLDKASKLVGVCSEGVCGALDLAGKVIIPFKYQQLAPCSEGLCAANFGGKWGYIDAVGNTVIPHQYDMASPFALGAASVTKEGKSYLIDKRGEIIYTFLEKGDYTLEKQGDLLVVTAHTSKNGEIEKRMGIFDGRYKMVVPFICDWVGETSGFSDALVILKDNKWGFVDCKGKIIADFLYEQYVSSSYVNGLMPVKKNGAT